MINLFLKDLTRSIQAQKEYSAIMERITQGKYPCEVEGPEGLFLAVLINKIHSVSSKPSLVVVPTENEATILARDLFLIGNDVKMFPWTGISPYGPVISHAAESGKRTRVLSSLLKGNADLIVTSLRSFLSSVPPRGYLENLQIDISMGGEFNPIDLEKRLAVLGYLRVPQVSMHGEFALRGEVLDVYPPGMDEAIRVVFDFEEVEAIRTFNPLSQVSLNPLEFFTIFPAKEMVWTEERFDELTAYLKSRKDVADDTWDMVAEIREGAEIPGENLLFPASFSKPGSIVDYIPKDSFLFLIHNEHLTSNWDALKKEYRELYIQARSLQEYYVPPTDKILLDYEQVINGRERIFRFPAIRSPKKIGNRISFQYEGPKSYFGNVSYLREEIARMRESKYQISVFADTEVQASRISQLLKEDDITVIPAAISHGFTLPSMKIAVIQEEEIFGRRKRRPKSVKTVKSAAIDTFVELNPGDYVVHVNYGIGMFKGIERIQAAGTERDYIQLAYADEETIFIPIEQVNLVQRYIGQEGRKPRLDKIGGKSWESRKGKVRKSVEDLAEMLLDLYAKRKVSQGFAFPFDTDWQIEFEANFPYEETIDQIRCIEEVKADMEKPEPMDRLVCGDVGYGKTEVAMRAAFKAVTGGKQVAFLAPTTILAEQHFENFTERFEKYPVKIRMLSRFVSKADQKKCLAKLVDGEVDIVIGTHRLLQKDVSFKNLGLLVVDEEQRFGVKDKERLKAMRANVDCLTLSATPIPRTLHMSLLKLRDMSLLTTPPHNRRPIETYIREFDEQTVAGAIRREMDRGGQVFYLHNRVETLGHVKRFIENLVPDALVEVAHGKLHGDELEEIMHRFVRGASQVLASTTIIENGIDIPNVNTIIIDRADMYGISQLYQLRGRVGRSDRLAYAYLLYPTERALSELAMKRLQIISDHTELGSGFKVALKDLEVRGAGNLLGGQQHGEILSVGFDLYIRLLDQAINERKDNPEDIPPEVYLELEYSGYIPDRYIREPVEKMEVYKKVASISSEEELEGVYAELMDRFGPLPDEVRSLMSLAEIRILCAKLRVSSLKERKGEVEVEFSRIADISLDKAMRLIKESNGAVKPDPKRPNVLRLKVGKIGLAEKSEFLRERLESLI
ncbi:MAG: transcription-repair coupling factor [Spirochaetales bacterium]|jgi:transcription-repair coupling factor (superfamily II helicase)|nr:transcription-repair coupling factor [Spirochaetales bacterium]